MTGAETTMAEDWRVTITVTSETGRWLAERLQAHEVEERASSALGGRIALSADDGANAFLYADTRVGAAEARRLAEAVLQEEGIEGTSALDRWHPLEERWEPADVPLPETEAEREAERGRLDAQDAADTAASGFAQWEVRLDLPDHRSAVDLGERLEAEGIPVTRRWRYLLAGAATRDDAEGLAQRLRSEAPAGATVQVQPGGEMAWEVAPGRPLVLFLIPN